MYKTMIAVLLLACLVGCGAQPSESQSAPSSSMTQLEAASDSQTEGNSQATPTPAPASSSQDPSSAGSSRHRLRSLPPHQSRPKALHKLLKPVAQMPQLQPTVPCPLNLQRAQISGGTSIPATAPTGRCRRTSTPSGLKPDCLH